MRWPVLVRNVPPLPVPWSVGDHVSVPLQWCDDPGLLGLPEMPLRARLMPGSDDEWCAQLLDSGGVTALRIHHRETGEVRLTRCLEYDVLWSWDSVPKTTGTVRRIRVIQDLHDRGPEFWVPVPGARRLIDVPSTDPQHLTDDPPGPEADPPDDDPDPADLRLYSPEQYYALARNHLPPQQWQSTAFLADLDVPHP